MDERDAFIRRTLAGAAGVGSAGTVVLLLFGRFGWAAGFALGVAVSLGNFHLITRAVLRLTDTETTQASGHLWKGALFRFGIVVIVLLAAVMVFRVNVVALLAGLLITQIVMIGYWIVRSVRSVH